MSVYFDADGKRWPVRTDSRGVILRRGQQVAYNLSGDVVLGEIVNVTNSAVTVQPEVRKRYSKSPTSRVRNSRSILVLEQPS